MVGRVVAANTIPDAIISPELEEKLAKEEGEKPIPLTTQQCQKLLMEVLTNNGSIGKLDGPGWTKQTALKAKRLLLEFHHVFSLKENEIGCTDDAEHVIELLEGEDEPFKERFRWIAPHEVEEVREHIQEMLDGGRYSPVTIAMVQCSSVGSEERWHPQILYRLSVPERQDQEGFSPTAERA